MSGPAAAQEASSARETHRCSYYRRLKLLRKEKDSWGWKKNTGHVDQEVGTNTCNEQFILWHEWMHRHIKKWSVILAGELDHEFDTYQLAFKEFSLSSNEWKMLVHVWKNLLCFVTYIWILILQLLMMQYMKEFNRKNRRPCLDLFTKSSFDWPVKGISIKLVLVHSFKAAICRNFVLKMWGKKKKIIWWNNNRHYVKDFNVFCCGEHTWAC